MEDVGRFLQWAMPPGSSQFCSVLMLKRRQAEAEESSVGSFWRLVGYPMHFAIVVPDSDLLLLVGTDER